MRVLISACLLGENCKYSGGNNRNETVLAWLREQGHEAVPVCPEQLGGLPTPRTPAENWPIPRPERASVSRTEWPWLRK